MARDPRVVFPMMQNVIGSARMHIGCLVRPSYIRRWCCSSLEGFWLLLVRMKTPRLPHSVISLRILSARRKYAGEATPVVWKSVGGFLNNVKAMGMLPMFKAFLSINMGNMSRDGTAQFLA